MFFSCWKHAHIMPPARPALLSRKFNLISITILGVFDLMSAFIKIAILSKHLTWLNSSNQNDECWRWWKRWHRTYQNCSMRQKINLKSTHQPVIHKIDRHCNDTLCRRKFHARHVHLEHFLHFQSNAFNSYIIKIILI